MRSCRLGLVALAAALCAHGRAEIVVTQYNDYYQQPDDYFVFAPSNIVIYNYDEGQVYDFDCWDCQTDGPCVPAKIESITAVPGVGNIEIT